MLKISVKNFGPIIEGTVDLKPLTIFVGPSNAGKSYLATLIYSLMRAFEDLAYPYGGIIGYDPIRSRRRFRHRVFLGLDNEFEITDKAAKAIEVWVQSINPNARRGVETPFVKLPDEMQRHVYGVVESSLDSLKPLFNRELQRCHGDISAIRSRRTEADRLQIGLEQSQALLDLKFGDQGSSVALTRKKCDLSQSKVEIPRDLLKVLLTQSSRRSSRSKESRRMNYVDWLAPLIETASTPLFEDFPSSSYYLPAARSGIAQGHKAIASILVRQSSFAAIRPLEIPTLSGVITDFMGHILTMERVVGGRRSITDLKEVVDFLEKKVVRGRIDIDRGKEITYPEISYVPSIGQPQMGSFPFHKTSSMVSELAPFVLFLKYLVREGDLIILEEPESHLHPASQRQMARGIVRLVNAGVKVIITTHSDYFIGQINNLVKLSRASKQKLAKKNYEGTDCLKPDDVSAYHFDLDNDLGVSSVKELPIVPDFGIDEQEFAHVSEALYEETISLQRGRAK